MSSSPNTLTDIPLLLDGDGYLIELTDDNSAVCIIRVLLFPENINTNPRHCEWRELLPHVKEKIVYSVNRRHPKRMVKISC